MVLSIIILNWNTKEDTIKCLLSIQEHPSKYETEVIVVDNASSDGSRERISERCPWVKILVNPKNIGFGAGNNRGIPAAGGEFVLFLNSDTILTEGALDGMVDFAKDHPDIGVIGPRLLNSDGSLQYSCRRFPNLAAGFFRNTPLGRLFPHNRYTRDYLMNDWDHESERDVDWLSGAALMIRRDLLSTLGGFDERFYMYCEDVDLCYRSHQQGWRVTYYPYAKIYHRIGRSSDKVPTRMTWFFHQSMYLFYKKHYARSTFILIRPFIIPGLIARASGQLIRYKWRNMRKRLK